MSGDTAHESILRVAKDQGDILATRAANQILVRVQQAAALRVLAETLQHEAYYLATVVANDERELDDGCFKIYYVFSHARADLFLIVEYLLPANQSTYPSIYDTFPAVDVFEREMRDMMGLAPDGGRAVDVQSGSWLHEHFPPGLSPLRRDRTTAELRATITAYNSEHKQRATSSDANLPSPGRLLLPVGPIHAGIIEPGRFVFSLAGETIDDLSIKLGYTHRGIERIFQARMGLEDGWRLAEQVCGDSSFAHSLAYCLAAEALSGIEAPTTAQLLRGLFLELERIYNHVADTGALAQDVALDMISAEIAVIREELVRLNQAIAGHRYLRGVNRVGGVILPHPLDVERVLTTLDRQLTRYTTRAESMAALPGFRDRALHVGFLSKPEAVRLNATGLAARASGIEQDYRLQHPSGIYRQEWLQQKLRRSVDSYLAPGYDKEASGCDVYARFLTRLAEVKASREIIHDLLHQLSGLPTQPDTTVVEPVHFASANNFTFALGYAEGWRGDVIYWLMQDKLHQIYRCKVRDASQLNWAALRASIVPHEADGVLYETALADFPVINKSFNLSYSGHDL